MSTGSGTSTQSLDKMVKHGHEEIAKKLRDKYGKVVPFYNVRRESFCTTIPNYGRFAGDFGEYAEEHLDEYSISESGTVEAMGSSQHDKYVLKKRS